MNIHQTFHSDGLWFHSDGLSPFSIIKLSTHPSITVITGLSPSKGPEETSESSFGRAPSIFRPRLGRRLPPDSPLVFPVVPGSVRPTKGHLLGSGPLSGPFVYVCDPSCIFHRLSSDYVHPGHVSPLPITFSSTNPNVSPKKKKKNYIVHGVE